MKRAYRTIPIQIIILALLSFPFTSSSTTYEVTGALVSENDAPIADHQVFLYNSDDEQIASDRTDDQGRFTLSYQDIPTSADPGMGPDRPSEFTLGSSYPNPFNPHTTVPFYAPENTHAVITVYNILGQQVLRTQADVSAGSHEIQVSLGGSLSQGQYLIRVQGDGFALTQSMTFVSAGIGGGNQEIRVRQGGQSSAPVSSRKKQMDNDVVYRVVVEETDRYQGKEVTIAPSENLDTGSLVLAIKQEPLKKLPGDEDEKVVNATYNLSAPSQATEENVSTVEVEEVQQRILRTEIGISLHPEASTGQINSLLQKYDAEIVDMVDNRGLVILQFPDPGDLESLDILNQQLADEDIVQFVIPSVIMEDPEPVQFDTHQKIPPYLSNEARIEHHLAARAHAVWNLRDAVTQLPNRPWVVIVDWFGDGVPGEGFNANFQKADFETGNPNIHGYYVLGIMSGLFDNNEDLDPNSNDVVGMFPEQLNIRAIDIRRTSFFTRIRLMNSVKSLLSEIIDEDNNAQIILNTSIVATQSYQQPYHASYWIRLIRGESADDSIENNYVHFTAAGNVEKDPDGNITRRWPAEESSMFAYAALKDPDPLFSEKIDRLNNTFVVENRVNTLPVDNDTQRERPFPGCAFDESIMGGNLSAMGTTVFSFGACMIRDSEGKCKQYDTRSENGTSLASPQAAGVAAYIWSVNPDLSVDEVINIIHETAENRQTTTLTSENLPCNEISPQPVVDAYAAVLAAGGMNVRRVLLDVTDTGTFDESDIDKFLTEFEERDGALDYSRYDLNGDGKTGGDGLDRFDLNHDIEFGTVSQNIEDVEVTFDESGLTDLDILCYYAYSDLYEGDEELRTELLEGHCFKDDDDTGYDGDWPRDTETEVVDVTNPETGQTWMDRNLGASRAATSMDDEEAYGDLYQWGRAADGHEKRNSGTTSTLSSTDTPGHGDFITSSSGSNWDDWRSPQNDNLWQGVNGINNPCPDGYRLPTEAEWEAERQSWSINNGADAFESPLRLPVAGSRQVSSGSLDDVGSLGFYWSSSLSGTSARYLDVYSSFAIVVGSHRAYGFSVRCLNN